MSGFHGFKERVGWLIGERDFSSIHRWVNLEQRSQCILFSVVFTPSPPSPYGSVWAQTVISLLVANTVSPIWLEWRGFIGPKKKTSVGLLVFNPFWGREMGATVTVSIGEMDDSVCYSCLCFLRKLMCGQHNTLLSAKIKTEKYFTS